MSTKANLRGPAYISGKGARYAQAIATIASGSGLLSGFDIASVSAALLFLRNQFQLDNLQIEIAASMALVGGLSGACVAGAASDRWGRRVCLLGAAACYLASSACTSFASNFSVFLLARFLSGLAFGFTGTVTPAYISEISPRQVRGILTSGYQFAIMLGMLIGYLTNWWIAAVGNESWRWMFAAASIPAAALLLGLLWVPESPRWLITHGRREKGSSVLIRILGENAAGQEAAAITTEFCDGCAVAPKLRNSGIGKRIAVAVFLTVFQQFSGFNAVLYYGSLIFRDHFRLHSATLAIAANVPIALVNVICGVLAMHFIDRWGRRMLLMSATVGMTCCLCTLALALQLYPDSFALTFGCVLAYVGFFAAGLGPGVWVYVSEIFPTEVRGRSISIATSFAWAACITVTSTFLSIVRAKGLSFTFFLYAALCCLGFFLIRRWVPETRGRSLEEIQRSWR